MAGWGRPLGGGHLSKGQTEERGGICATCPSIAREEASPTGQVKGPTAGGLLGRPQGHPRMPGFKTHVPSKPIPGPHGAQSVSWARREGVGCRSARW